MNRMLKWFKFTHLPAHLQEVSAPCAELATQMDAALPEGAEKTAGMRKLLHLVFACWVQGVAFDPSRWEQVAGKAQEMAQRAAMAPTSAAAVPLVTCLAAPVSKREAKRRKAAHSPQGPCGVVPQKRPEFERPPSALIIPIRTPSCQGDHAPDFSSC